MANPLAPDAGGDPQQPVGPWEAQFARYLDQAPGWTYGSVLPVATNNETGAVRPAIPGFVRDIGQGALQLLDGPATGTVTPQASMALASLPVAGGLAAGAEAATNPLLRSGPIVAYHGSPYDFAAFDASKIGTGEGAQAYGHGLYFAGNEAVAKGYRDALAPLGTLNARGDTGSAGMAARAMQGASSPEEGIANLDYNLMIHKAGNEGQINPEFGAKVAEAKRLIQGGGQGRMYQVQLNADPDAMLDWDKSITADHPAVSAVESARKSVHGDNDVAALGNSNFRADIEDGDFTGADVWSTLSKLLGPAKAAEALKKAGIPGIRYLDQGSRNAGEGTSNYVVFDPKTIEIMKKYGLAGGVPQAPGQQQQTPPGWT